MDEAGIITEMEFMGRCITISHIVIITDIDSITVITILQDLDTITILTLMIMFIGGGAWSTAAEAEAKYIQHYRWSGESEI